MSREEIIERDFFDCASSAISRRYGRAAHPSQSSARTSAVGQKQTCAVQQLMSASARSRHAQCNSGCPLSARTGHWNINASGSGPLIVVTGMNVTAVFALEEVHIISLFAPFDSLPKLQFAATTRTRARIGTGGLHRTDVAHGGQMAL